MKEKLRALSIAVYAVLAVTGASAICALIALVISFKEKRYE